MLSHRVAALIEPSALALLLYKWCCQCNQKTTETAPPASVLVDFFCQFRASLLVEVYVVL